MDKMVYFKSINDDTKVAFKSVDKFVKFKKIKTIVEEENVTLDDWALDNVIKYVIAVIIFVLFIKDLLI